MITALLFALVMQTQVNEETPQEFVPQSLEELDAAIFKDRLVTAYGETRGSRNSEWEVSRAGETQTWKWESGEFSCPQPEAWDCKSLVPVSFRWWQTRNSWLEPWVSFRRTGFSLDEAFRPLGDRSSELEKLISDEEMEMNFFDDQAETEEVQLGGKRLALETWEWTSNSGDRVKVSISLRENHWVEKIETADSVEYIEWTRPNRWTRPSIEKVIYDRAGQRLSFRLKPSE